MTFKVQELNSGGIAVIFGERDRDAGYELAVAYLASKTVKGQQRISPIVSEGLASVRRRVENTIGNSDSEIKLTLNTPVVSKLGGLTAEKVADEISSMIFNKIEQKYGRAIPVYFRPFYTELEAVSGKEISKIHKVRTKGENVRDYPFRKMDTAIRELSADYVFEFAKRYEFK